MIRRAILKSTIHGLLRGTPYYVKPGASGYAKIYPQNTDAI